MRGILHKSDGEWQVKYQMVVRNCLFCKPYYSLKQMSLDIGDYSKKLIEGSEIEFDLINAEEGRIAKLISIK